MLRRSIIWILLFPVLVKAQSYSYVHYGLKEGLPSKRVYAACQDKDGFVWFATDNGVSRFDGTRFRNFTTEEGLSDNDIINIYCDSKNRIWFAPFKKDICYYYKGKIYNRKNDSILKKTTLASNPVNIIEDKEGNIWVLQESGLNYITPAGDWVDFISQARFPDKKYSLQQIGPLPEGGITLISGLFTGSDYKENVFWEYRNGTLKQIMKSRAAMSPSRYYILPGARTSVYTNEKNQILIEDRLTLTKHVLPPFNNLNTITGNGDSIVFFNTGSGSFYYNVQTGQQPGFFLPGKTISRSFIDQEGNKWFATLDDGVYKLSSAAIRHFSFNPSAFDNKEVFSITRHGDELLAGLNSGMIARIDKNDQLHYFSTGIDTGKSFDRVLQIETLPGGRVLCRSDKGLCFFSKDKQVLHTDRTPVKCLFAADSNFIGSTTYDIRRWAYAFPLRHTILLPERASAVLERNDSVYAGTLDDLVIITPRGEKVSLGSDVPELQNKITFIIAGPDHTVWVGTYYSGIIALKNNRLLTKLTVKDGLSSNSCRSAFFDGKNLWVGTDKGLNKVNIAGPSYAVTRYTATDGLPDEVINTVYVEDKKVFTGTSSGLTWFDAEKITADSRCNLLLEKITIDGSELELKEQLTVSYSKKNLTFSFAAVSLKATGQISYRYRLKGLNEEWLTTEDPVLNFISLPSGNSYVLEIYAVNKAGVKSNTLVIPFTITRPYWQTTVFRMAVLAALLLSGWLIIRSRTNAVRKKETAKRTIQQQIFQLEQKAKRAQMNPHFIFNCISSIQHFMFANDLETSNNYISMFARLIRQTLDNSDKMLIPLAEEISYLDTYLRLEQMRFAGKFTYSISVEPVIQTDFIFIPAMLLQPYIENAVRHGIRHRKEEGGSISIIFSKEADSILCTVEDNGVGRQAAEAFKGSSHIEYQSKGMQLTADRIEAINKIYQGQLQVQVIDLLNDQQEPAGTRVVLRFPAELTEK